MKWFNVIKNDRDFENKLVYIINCLLFNQMRIQRLSAMFPRVIRRVFVM